jgi:hypothetical protein
MSSVTPSIGFDDTFQTQTQTQTRTQTQNPTPAPEPREPPQNQNKVQIELSEQSTVKAHVAEAPAVAPKVDGALAIKEGSIALAPSIDFPRLHDMRSKFLLPMHQFCGQYCEVQRVRGRQVQLRLRHMITNGKIEAEDNSSYWWDIDIMPSCNQRFCTQGCALVEWTDSGRCDICAALFPKGGTVLHCQEHNYDVCTFCECPSFLSR